jgi:NAD(P)-dependent dehydrogenase (short-subunit alcohol dehydrogenase family)
VFVNIASLTAEQGYPYNSVYASSKAAVATLSESLSIELAEFGIRVRAILPGQHATRIFTKIDVGSETPDSYQQGIADFFAHNSPTGSEPAVTAEMIYRATVDPDPERVRYHSGPDSVSIPRAKQILGLEGYWREFRESVAGRPSPLWKAVSPAAGTTPVDFEL